MYPVDFYDLTPTEINDLILAAIKRRESEMKSRAAFAWHTAYLTGLAVRAPKSFPHSAAEHFTWLDSTPAWQRSKQEMAQIAAKHNKRRGEA